MIDFHCHLDLYPDPQELADQCVVRNMYVLSVTTAPSAWKKSREFLERKGRVRVALGLHPQIVHERHNEIELFASLIGEAQYVGEIGLDGAPEFRAHWKIQTETFEQALAITAKAGGRVMSLHCRNAATPVLEAIARHRDVGLPVLHWFSGTQEELRRAAALDCWFSVGPTMLSSERGKALVAAMPRDRVLTETDGPFAKLEGTSVFPWDVQYAMAALSVLWGTTQQETSAQLHENFREIAALGAPEIARA